MKTQANKEPHQGNNSIPEPFGNPGIQGPTNEATGLLGMQGPSGKPGLPGKLGLIGNKGNIGVEGVRGYSYEDEVTENKQLRKDTDDIIQRIKDLPPSRERSLSITKLQEGVMWLGMDIKRLGEANPYPSSKDASTGTVIEPTADGLKF